ncbi:MAG: PD-(D/E)XK nuclease family transposase [Bacteroidales bacterium]|nr:PD-(D/E)XK nuclease family transposase [Bacteroidales bacterium]
MGKFANLLYDDSFKVVVCAPGNERLLMDIVELLVPGKKLKSLELKDKEQHGLSISDKISNFDLYCTSETGEQFIVEMQNAQQHHYADRMLCYASHPIRNQLAKKLAERREKIKSGIPAPVMDYRLLPVYVVSILNFSIPHESETVLEDGLVSRYAIMSKDSGELMTDSLLFVYLELGRLKARKGESALCKTLLERFAYSLKYMHELEQRPEGYDDDLLKRLYGASEFANWSTDKQFEYETVMRTEIDRLAELNYAVEEATTKLKAANEKAEAAKKQAETERNEAEAAKKQAETARDEAVAQKEQGIKNLLMMGVGPETIAKAFNLNPKELDTLKP